MKRSKIQMITLFLYFFYIFNVINYSHSSEQLPNYSIFISSLQILDENNVDHYGGFQSYTGENISNLRNTFYGIHLGKIGSDYTNLNKFACIEYITGRTQIDGGYEPESNMFSSYIDSTYFAIDSLSALDAISWINSNTLDWIRQRQKLDAKDLENYGGFEWKENFNTTYVEATYYGVQSLIELNALYSVNSIATMNWLEGRKNPDSGFGPTASISFSTIKDTHFAIETIINLNNFDTIDKVATTSFVKHLQNLNLSEELNYGGFKPFDGPMNSSLEATYHAVKILEHLSQLDEINSTLIRDFVYSKYIEKGGFKDSFLEYPNIKDTFHAINILSILENWEEENNGRSQTPNNFHLMGIFLIIGIIGAMFFYGYLKKPTRSKKIISKMKRGKKRFS